MATFGDWKRLARVKLLEHVDQAWIDGADPVLLAEMLMAMAQVARIEASADWDDPETHRLIRWWLRRSLDIGARMGLPDAMQARRQHLALVVDESGRVL